MEIKEKIGNFGRFSIYLGINTDDEARIKDKDEWKGEDFSVACNRVNRVLNQLEEHEDFESLIKYKKLYQQMRDLINNAQAEDANEDYKLQAELGEIEEEETPF